MMKDKVEYTHCLKCNGTGLSSQDGYTCCQACIGQGGLYIEPKKVVTKTNKSIDKNSPSLDNRAQQQTTKQKEE